MHPNNVINLYRIGVRGMPIRTIGPGDLADPSAPSLWKRMAAFGAAVLDVARETRALETSLLGRSHYRRFRDS
jgi:hypothetical protein